MKQHNFMLDTETQRLLKELRKTDPNYSMSNVVRDAIRLIADARGVK